jgi:XTP/dITP diphosphohydrolase
MIKSLFFKNKIESSHVKVTNFMDKRLVAFQRLLDIMDDLREKCPWDRKQTFDSLSSLTIEEVYELIDAIQKKDLKGINEEIGDVMLHMVFYAKMGSEMNEFGIHDALNSICDKLIRRHPHIYGDVEVENAEEVKQNWEKIKMAEGKKSVLEGVPNSMPALIKAQRMQEKAAQVGFEWNHSDDVWDKVQEELLEFRNADIDNSREEMTEEFGDVLFSLINFARFKNIDANFALDLTNRKFKSRIEYIERNTSKQLTDMTLDEMDALWNEAKMMLPKRTSKS